MFKKSSILTLPTLLLFMTVASSTGYAQNITIQGKDFYKDGKSWLPKGIDVEAFNRPLASSTSSSMNASAKTGRDSWNNAEIKAINNVFGADIIRIVVSQPGLDPQSPIYDHQYLSDVLMATKQARAAGFIVVLTINAQAESGIPHLPCMPNDSTTRAWQAVTPSLIHDNGIMLELFNEPCRANWKDAQTEWAQEMQSLINTLRTIGAENILLLDGLEFAQAPNSLFPLVRDSIPNRLAMAVHPYVNSLKGVDLNNLEGYFKSRFGDTADKYPLIATEWNATPTNGCLSEVTPQVALAVVRYLEAHHIGLIGWAIDSNYGKMVKDHINYEPTDYTSFNGCTKTPTESGGGKLLANYPND